MTRLCALLVALLALSLAVFAANYNGVVVFGDSLSDSGNLYNFLDKLYPPPPYYHGRFSNGPVGVEYIALHYSAPLSDFAWGGATTGVGDEGDFGTQTTLGLLRLPGMLTQYVLNSNKITPSLAANGLFVLWGGPNDFDSNGLSTATADRAVADLITLIVALKLKGVQHILVLGMPDLGVTPSYRNSGKATQGTQLSKYFNTELVAALHGTGAKYFDTFTLVDDMVANPAKYGFTNVKDPCYNGLFKVCSNPNGYLFWDTIHPTTYAHYLLAYYVEQSLGMVVVPEMEETAN
jgi:phospholipase/lecithinase/hemolysin